MIALPETVSLPLKVDDHGVIRVSGTRVTLDSVIARFLQGDTPETIHQAFDVLPLNDIYAVIAYYLAHQVDLDAYLQQSQADAEHLRQQLEASYSTEQSAFNERLRKLAEEKRHQRDG